MDYNWVLNSFSQALTEQPLKSTVLSPKSIRLCGLYFVMAYVLCVFFFSCWSIFYGGKAIIVAWHKLTWWLWPWFAVVSEQQLLAANVIAECMDLKGIWRAFEGFATNQSAPRSYRLKFVCGLVNTGSLEGDVSANFMLFIAHFATLSKWVSSTKSRWTWIWHCLLCWLYHSSSGMKYQLSGTKRLMFYWK